MDKTAEKLLFLYGKKVLGKNAGGRMVKLMREKGLEGAMVALEMADGKQDAREYVGAAIREAKAPPMDEATVAQLYARYEAKLARNG